MGEWLELDLTPDERARAEVAARAQGLSLEAWISAQVRADILMFEHLDARVATGPGALDTRNERRAGGYAVPGRRQAG